MLLNYGVGEDSLESLDCMEIQPVHPKGDQFWVFIGRTHAEAETPVLWPPDAKNWLIWKDPNAGKDWRWEERGTTRLWDGWMASPTQWTWVCVNSGLGDGQGGLVCCGVAKSRTRLSDWTELIYSLQDATWMQSQKWQNDLCLFPREIIQSHSNPSLCPDQ